MAPAWLQAAPATIGVASIGSSPSNCTRLMGQAPRLMRICAPSASISRSSQTRPQKGQAMSRWTLLPAAMPGSIVFDVGEALVRVRRALQRAALLGRLPTDHILD